MVKKKYFSIFLSFLLLFNTCIIYNAKSIAPTAVLWYPETLHTLACATAYLINYYTTRKHHHALYETNVSTTLHTTNNHTNIEDSLFFTRITLSEEPVSEIIHHTA